MCWQARRAGSAIGATKVLAANTPARAFPFIHSGEQVAGRGGQNGSTPTHADLRLGRYSGSTMGIEVRTRWLGAIVVAGLLMLAVGAPAEANAGKGSKQGRVELLRTSQQRLLDSGRLVERVRAGGRWKIRTHARIRGARKGAKSATIANRVEARFKGKRKLALRLNARGERRIRRCGNQRLIVQVRVVGGKPRRDRGTRLRDVQRLRTDSSRCDRGGKGGGGSGAGGGDSGGGVDTRNADRCDVLDPSVCLYPFPNDHFTVADSSSATGRRVHFDVRSMPANRAGVPIVPDDHNRADGFSPGNMLITKVPGLETPKAFENTGAVPIDDMARYRDPNQPIVVIDAATGERHPVWSELDANPADPADVTLIIRPQRNFEEGHHYLVGLRNLRDAKDRPIEAGRAFRLYRDRIKTSDPAIEARRPEMERTLDGLVAAGIKRSKLYLAWDFTVASAESLAEQRLLSIRDDAFAKLGDTDLADLVVQGSSPAFTVTNVENRRPAEDPRIARVVEGTVTAPCYLDTPGCAQGGQFRFAPGGYQPQAIPGNLDTFQFQCDIPRSALDGGANPARPSLYGHGLLGGLGEVGAGNVSQMANDHKMMFCATDWAGFSTKDAPTVALILQDLNNFPKLVDHTEQGFINFMMLGRAMIHPQGFAADPAFQDGSGASVIDTTRLFYDGNSQGGILGGPLVATSPDIDRGVLGVPGMNYSTLLRRSSDFEGYATGAIFGPDTPLGLYDSYPNELERPLVLSLIQMLWDRGENDGYAHHISADPYPNTPPSEVLLHEAFSDHQVANVTAETMARTIGARKVAGLDPGRFPGADPFFDIPTIDSFPYEGSAIVDWDSGSPNAPAQNTPPHEGEDPHGHPRSDPKAQQQKSDFLQVDGKVTNVCGAGACYANGYSGP